MNVWWKQLLLAAAIVFVIESLAALARWYNNKDRR